MELDLVSTFGSFYMNSLGLNFMTYKKKKLFISTFSEDDVERIEYNILCH